MSVGDVYRLIDNQTYLSGITKNVYYYEHVAGSGGADDLITAFILDVLLAIRNVQSAFLTHESFEAYNLDNLADFNAVPVTTGGAGAVAGEGMPRFNAWGFQLVRTTRFTRNGAKRIGGVAEASQNGGVPASASVTDALTDVATAIGGSIDDTVGNEFAPVIVRLTVDDLVDVKNPVSGALYKRLTTQNSRK